MGLFPVGGGADGFNTGRDVGRGVIHGSVVRANLNDDDFWFNAIQFSVFDAPQDVLGPVPPEAEG